MLAERPADTDLAERDERESVAGNAPPAADHVIVNALSGERIIIRVSGAQSGGALLRFDLYLPPGGHVPARHVHPAQEERFTVVSGTMRFRLGRRTLLAQPGETVVIPARVAHWFGNAGAEVSHAVVEARPALRMEELFEANEAIRVARLFGGLRLPWLTDLARVLLEFQREVAIPDIPAVCSRIMLAPLAWLGRRQVAASRDGADR